MLVLDNDVDSFMLMMMIDDNNHNGHYHYVRFFDFCIIIIKLIIRPMPLNSKGAGEWRHNVLGLSVCTPNYLVTMISGEPLGGF